MEEAEAAAGFFLKSCWIWALRLVLLAWLWGGWVRGGWVGWAESIDQRVDSVHGFLGEGLIHGFDSIGRLNPSAYPPNRSIHANQSTTHTTGTRG